MSPPRALAALAILLVIPLAVPAQAAGLQVDAVASARLAAVGTFDVAPAQGGASGVAQGAIVSGVLATGGAEEPTLRGFSVATDAGASTTYFSTIDIDGFVPSSQLRGVGTSALALEGSGIRVTLSDSVSSLLVIHAAADRGAPAHVALATPANVTLTAVETTGRVVRIEGGAQAGGGQASGALVLAAANAGAASGSSLAITGAQDLAATLAPGAQLVFRADRAQPVFDAAVVDALASGTLAAEVTSDFSGGARLIADANPLASATTRTTHDLPQRVSTLLRAEANGSALLAYNLDYLDVPARSAEDVGVYFDGALGQRVATAAEVASQPDAFWAESFDGRVLVLAHAAPHIRHAREITVAALPGQDVSTLARLDARAELAAQVAGGFERVGRGGILGNFTRFHASEASASLEDVTDVRSATQVFRRVALAADEAPQARGALDQPDAVSARMTTSVGGEPRAVATLTDSVFATLRVEAAASTTVLFELGPEIRAALSPTAADVVALDGPSGRVGHLVLTGEGALDVEGGTVRATLEEGAAVVFRSAAEARTRAGADVLIEAIAAGALAGEISAGFAQNAITSARVAYEPGVEILVDAAPEATHRGAVAFDVLAEGAARAGILVSLITDQATLAARDGADVAVAVGGEPAAAVESAAELLAQSQAGATQAAYVATATLSGQTHVVVLVPATQARGGARVVVESALEAQRRLDAALDVFGAFAAGHGGAARGDIVSLVARPEAGLLLDYAVSARSDATASEGRVTTVFDSVRLGDGALAATGAPSATALRFQGPEGTIEVFDVSAGVLKLAAESSTTAALALASGILAEQASPQVVALHGADFEGAIVSSSPLTVQGNTILATLEPGAQVIFKAFSGFESQLTAEDRLAQAQAIASGALIGQVIVRSDAQTHVTSATSVNYYPAIASGAVVGSSMGALDAQTEGVEPGYGAVQAVTQVVSTEKVELVVASGSTLGRSVIVSLDRNTVSGLVSGTATLLVDGEPVPAASSYADALTPDADKYFLITAGHEVGLQAVIALSHFSTRTITLASPPAQSVFLWTTIALAIIVLAQVAVPAIRRWTRA